MKNSTIKNETSENYNSYKPESKSSTIDNEERISCSRDGKNLIKSHLTYEQKEQMKNQELFGVLFLNNKNKIIDSRVIFIGTVNEAVVSPRDIFRPALEVGAVRIIAWHNHPSGDTTPSQEDIALGKRLFDCGEMLGVQQLDNLIISSDFKNYVSMRDLGYI
jgi:DNA repair protein RadC